MALSTEEINRIVKLIEMKSPYACKKLTVKTIRDNITTSHGE